MSHLGSGGIYIPVPSDAQPLRLPEQHGIRPTRHHSTILPCTPQRSRHLSTRYLGARVVRRRKAVRSLFETFAFAQENCICVRQERHYCTRRSFDATLRRCGLRGGGPCRYRPGSVCIHNSEPNYVRSSLCCNYIHPDQRLGTQPHVFLWQQCSCAKWRIRRRCIPR